MRTLASTILLALAAASTLHAQVKVTPAFVDFGYRGHNERPLETLLIENKGPAEVTIRELKPSCSCLTVEPAVIAAPIPAGGSVTVKIGMSSGRAMGILEKHLTLVTSDARVRPVEVPIRMSVFEGFSMEPYDVHFDGVVGGAPVTMTVDVTWSARGRPPRTFTLEPGVVKDGRSGRPSEHFESKVVDVPGGKRIELTLKPTYPEGHILGNLETKLDGRLFIVPIGGEMFRGIKVVPTYFNFNRVLADDPSTFVEESVLSATDGKAFRILGITSQVTQPKDGSVKIEVEDLPRGEGASKEKGSVEHVLRARVSRAAAAAAAGAGEKPSAGRPEEKAASLTLSFSGSVTVTTDHPEKKTVTLNSFGFFDDTKRKDSKKK